MNMNAMPAHEPEPTGFLDTVRDVPEVNELAVAEDMLTSTPEGLDSYRESLLSELSSTREHLTRLQNATVPSIPDIRTKKLIIKSLEGLLNETEGAIVLKGGELKPATPPISWDLHVIPEEAPKVAEVPQPVVQELPSTEELRTLDTNKLTALLLDLRKARQDGVVADANFISTGIGRNVVGTIETLEELIDTRQQREKPKERPQAPTSKKPLRGTIMSKLTSLFRRK